MKWTIILFAFLLQGCFWNAKSQPLIETVYVTQEVPGPTVPCKIDPVPKPVDLVANLKEADDIHYKVKTLLADRELSKAYRVKLETAITTCNQKD